MKTPLALAAAALLAAASCGPESFHRDLERDAGVDLGQGGDRADTGALADDAADAADVADGPAADSSGDRAGPDGPCATSFSGDVLYAFNTGSGVFVGPAPDPMGTL